MEKELLNPKTPETLNRVKTKSPRLWPRVLPVAGFFILYAQVLLETARGLLSYEGSHGLVILFLSGYMVWVRRKELADAEIVPAYMPGIALMIVGSLFFIGGALSGSLMIQQVSLILSLSGLVLLLWGGSIFEFLRLPIGYMLFMFPVFSELSGGFSSFLQLTTARIASFFLMLAGIPVHQSSVFIDLPYRSLEVAEACNGVNHIMALLALSIPLAYFGQKSRTKRVVLIASAPLIGILANGIRVAVIGVLAREEGPVHGPGDVFYVSSIFFSGMMGLLALHFLLRRINLFSPRRVPDPGRSLKRTERASRIPFGTKAAQANGSAVVALALLLATGAYTFLYQTVSVPLGSPLSAFPYTIENWTGRDTQGFPAPFQDAGADEVLNRIYEDGRGNKMGLFIGYFSRQGPGKKATSYRYAWQDTQGGRKISSGSAAVPRIREVSFAEAPGNAAGYFWYDLNGSILLDHYRVKISAAFRSLLKKPTNAAIVILWVEDKTESVPATEEERLKSMAAFFPLIRSHLRT